MELLNRIYRLHGILESHTYPISHNALLDRLECSRATLNRLIREMRDTWGAPIINIRGRGYTYDKQVTFQLPGLWFNPEELQSLFSLITLLENIQPGKLNSLFSSIKTRLIETVDKEMKTPSEIHRIRILGMAKRTPAKHFTSIASAVLERKKLEVSYHGRANDLPSTRIISPQRLVYYKDNWYLDTWCHRSQGIRTFSVDRIITAKYLSDMAINVKDSILNKKLAGSYGIFSGEADKVAILHFTPERAKWIADENWHPKQTSRFLQGGTYELGIPYSNPTELILDICRYGDDVEVIEPKELREMVAKKLSQAANIYT